LTAVVGACPIAVVGGTETHRRAVLLLVGVTLRSGLLTFGERRVSELVSDARAEG
jgi:hypothetical protein